MARCMAARPVQTIPIGAISTGPTRAKMGHMQSAPVRGESTAVHAVVASPCGCPITHCPGRRMCYMQEAGRGALTGQQMWTWLRHLQMRFPSGPCHWTSRPRGPRGADTASAHAHNFTDQCWEVMLQCGATHTTGDGPGVSGECRKPKFLGFEASGGRSKQSKLVWKPCSRF